MLKAVLRTLKDDERRVIDLILHNDGKILQKEIVTQTGLSRLRVHRIVVRLAERSIVKVKDTGNTNEIELSKWLKPPRDV